MMMIIIIVCLYYILKPKKKVPDEYWDGPTPTQAEREQNLQRIFHIIEQHPEGQFVRNNPEYVDEYLSRIELDLPEGVEKSGK